MGSQQHLEQLYRQAIYEVDLPGGTVAFQVGTPRTRCSRSLSW